MVALAAEGMLFMLQYSNSLPVILTTGGRKNLKPAWLGFFTHNSRMTIIR